MERLSLNKDWSFSHVGETASERVDVPFDGLLHEERSSQSLGADNTGFFVSHDYRYAKHFFAPEEWRGKSLLVDFEGVYHHAEVFLNGKKIASHDYGFTEFFVEISDNIVFGNGNDLVVVTHCEKEPNCRWFPGGGILRPVSLLIGDKGFILPHEVQIRTLSIAPAVISISLYEKSAQVQLEIFDPAQHKIIDQTCFLSQSDVLQVSLPNPFLWSMKTPWLYTYRLRRGEDVTEGRFGVRKLYWDENGFFLNGERTVLMGACVHSENGLLGGISDPSCEKRKIRLLKSVGFNAVRCAHNPCDRSFLEAADEMGLLLIDELYDGWYIPKTRYDNGADFEKNWEQNLKEMILRDGNHPSVVAYSLGNEVAETSEEKGIAFLKKMKARALSLDDSRPVTVGINVFFNYLYSLGFGVYREDKAMNNAAKPKSAGSKFFNDMAGMFGAEFMKTGATLRGVDRKTRDAFEVLDFAGYNYGIKRYRQDLRHYPRRLILGTETFVFDLFNARKAMEKNPRVIGDFVWAGIDYLGEVGIGAWLSKDRVDDGEKKVGWLSSGIGCIDLSGRLTTQALYAQTCLNVSPIALGVIPPPYFRKWHTPSAWRFTNAVSAWSFLGYENQKCSVEVYSSSLRVRLSLNGRSLGDKKTKNGVARFVIRYQKGTLKASNISSEGVELDSVSLSSPSEQTLLVARPEEETVHQGDLIFVHLLFEDEKGISKPLTRGLISLTDLTNGSLLAFGSACPFQPDSFFDSVSDTYLGECCVVIRSSGEGNVSFKAHSLYGDTSCQVTVLHKD